MQRVPFPLADKKKKPKNLCSWLLCGIAVFSFMIFFADAAQFDFRAASTPTGYEAPAIFAPVVNDCDLGLIGSCNDAGSYVSGPEAVLDTWIFSKAVPWWISFLIVAGSGAAVLMLMIGGGMIMISADKEELRGRGVKTVTWALVGLLIAIFAFTIVSILENIPLPGSTAPTTEATT